MLEVKTESLPEESVPAEGLSIAEAPRRSGISVHTLRYYERSGLVVTAIDRTAAGRRRYHRLDLEWITVCARLRATGMPIRQIRRYAELVRAGHGNEQGRLTLMHDHRGAVIAKILEEPKIFNSSITRSTSTRAGSLPATQPNYGHPGARPQPGNDPLQGGGYAAHGGFMRAPSAVTASRPVVVVTQADAPSGPASTLSSLSAGTRRASPECSAE